MMANVKTRRQSWWISRKAGESCRGKTAEVNPSRFLGYEKGSTVKVAMG